MEGVRIDYLSPATLGSHLETALDSPSSSEGVAVVPMEVLILARRRRDQLDVVELVKAGADVKRLRVYLTQHASGLLPLFDELAEEAIGE